MSRRNNRNFDRKIRSLIKEEYGVLTSPNSTEEEKREALRNLDRERESNRMGNLRLRPGSCRANADNGFHHHLPDGRMSIETEMNQNVDSAYGHQTFAPGYQRFSTQEVYTEPRCYWNTYNTTNRGFRTEIGDREKRFTDVETVSSYLQRNMDKAKLNYVNQVTTSLVRQSEVGGINKLTAMERYERSNTQQVTQEQLYLIAHNLGLFKEEYKSTEGQWVVVMPYAAPRSAEQVLYNQRGFTTRLSQDTLEKRQQGNYWMAPDRAYRDVYTPQIPPAKPDGGADRVEYYGGKDQRSQKSLRNPKRGDDYIRYSRINHNEQLEQRVQQLFRLIETTKVPYQRKKYQKELETIKSQMVSNRAQRRAQRQDQEVIREGNSFVQQSANMFSRWNTREYHQMREDYAYHRHLQLRESAQQILDQGQSKFLRG